ncbi:MAG: hypothetical protein CVT60_00605 [Actinobacteria bacterium HGW-Actinobacteria-10]|jgi:hypothetical protein|nr:MAG: hypothetical protein CVT60_00605 [Actinobacteria bacterium HGW-Actinobacteria-10]
MDDTMQFSPADDEETTVLELFGIKLNVRNPRLAEALLMDAKEALNTDVRHLGDAEAIRMAQAEISQAVPDVIVSVPTAHDADLDRHRTEFRQRVDHLGTELGFSVEPDGTWRSPLGLVLAVRSVIQDVSAAGAADLVAKLEEARRAGTTLCDSALIVARAQQDATDFALAIRQLKLHHMFRTVSVDNLELMKAMRLRGTLDHVHALALLSPVSEADVGEVLDIIRGAG